MSTKTTITIEIPDQTMGPLATDESNSSYCVAVENALRRLYPHASIEVDMAHSSRTTCVTSLPAGDEDDRIVETALEIAEEVWQGGNW